MSAIFAPQYGPGAVFAPSFGAGGTQATVSFMQDANVVAITGLTRPTATINFTQDNNIVALTAIAATPGSSGGFSAGDSTPAAVIDLSIQQGATFDSPSFIWKDGSGVPIDLTGCTAHMQIRQSTSAANTLADMTTANGGLTLGGTAGTISMLLTAAQTTAITARRGVYDLKLIAANGVVRRFAEGEVTISPEVTQ